MSFKPQEFLSEINRTGGVALASDFKVRIVPPTIMIDKGLHNQLEFRIDSIDLPARTVTSTPYTLYGAPQHIGHTLNYQPVSMTVILSPDMRERDFFLAWQDLIGGDHRKNNTNADAVKRLIRMILLH